ncbi:MAG: hypothetical protein JWN43_3183 [Gammaproteobacteria bacterium]|nr:hypothetical protein [Gammaproteobacteria bacterium]
MRAISAFLNGAGSRRNLKAGGTDPSRLKLAELLFTPGLRFGPVQVHTASVGRIRGRAPAGGSPRFPR